LAHREAIMGIMGRDNFARGDLASQPRFPLGVGGGGLIKEAESSFTSPAFSQPAAPLRQTSTSLAAETRDSIVVSSASVTGPTFFAPSA